MSLLRLALFGLLATIGFTSFAQSDGLVAYVPERPMERTADDTRIQFVESAVVGRIEAVVPIDADRVDILNGRGNIRRTYGHTELDQLSLGDLRPGTWTLRIHRQGKLAIRRFVVMERGSVVWSPNRPVRKR